jgi:hypothetical protein
MKSNATHQNKAAAPPAKKGWVQKQEDSFASREEAHRQSVLSNTSRVGGDGWGNEHLRAYKSTAPGVQRKEGEEEGNPMSKSKYRKDLHDFSGWGFIFSKQIIGNQYGSFWDSKDERYKSVNILSETVIDERAEEIDLRHGKDPAMPEEFGAKAVTMNFSMAFIDTNSGQTLQETRISGHSYFSIDKETGATELLSHEITVSEVVERSGNYAFGIQYLQDYGKTNPGFQGMITPNARLITEEEEAWGSASDLFTIVSFIIGTGVTLSGISPVVSIAISALVSGGSLVLPEFGMPLRFDRKLNHHLETASYSSSLHPPTWEYSNPKVLAGYIGGVTNQTDEADSPPSGYYDEDTKKPVEMPDWVPVITVDQVKQRK